MARARAMAALVVLALAASCSASRSFLVLGGQDVEEQPQAETIDLDSADAFNGRSSFNPVSWLMQQLDVIEQMQSQMLTSMLMPLGPQLVEVPVEPEHNEQALQQQPEDQQARLQHLGCNRFRAAMQEYAQQKTMSILAGERPSTQQGRMSEPMMRVSSSSASTKATPSSAIASSNDDYYYYYYDDDYNYDESQYAGFYDEAYGDARRDRSGSEDAGIEALSESVANQLVGMLEAAFGIVTGSDSSSSSSSSQASGSSTSSGRITYVRPDGAVRVIKDGYEDAYADVDVQQQSDDDNESDALYDYDSIAAEADAVLAKLEREYFSGDSRASPKGGRSGCKHSHGSSSSSSSSSSSMMSGGGGDMRSNSYRAHYDDEEEEEEDDEEEYEYSYEYDYDYSYTDDYAEGSYEYAPYGTPLTLVRVRPASSSSASASHGDGLSQPRTISISARQDGGEGMVLSVNGGHDQPSMLDWLVSSLVMQLLPLEGAVTLVSDGPMPDSPDSEDNMRPLYLQQQNPRAFADDMPLRGGPGMGHMGRMDGPMGGRTEPFVGPGPHGPMDGPDGPMPGRPLLPGFFPFWFGPRPEPMDDVASDGSPVPKPGMMGVVEPRPFFLPGFGPGGPGGRGPRGGEPFPPPHVHNDLDWHLLRPDGSLNWGLLALALLAAATAAVAVGFVVAAVQLRASMRAGRGVRARAARSCCLGGICGDGDVEVASDDDCRGETLLNPLLAEEIYGANELFVMEQQQGHAASGVECASEYVQLPGIDAYKALRG